MPTSPAKTPRKKNRTDRTPKKRARVDLPAAPTHSDADKARALVKYRELGTVLSACKAANISRDTWYRWKADDPAFAALVIAADEDVLDDLEEAAHERAKESSDTLLIFLLKSKRRAVFGDKQTVTVVHPDVTARLERQTSLFMERLTPEALAIVRGITNEVWQ